MNQRTMEYFFLHYDTNREAPGARIYEWFSVKEFMSFAFVNGCMTELILRFNKKTWMPSIAKIGHEGYHLVY